MTTGLFGLCETEEAKEVLLADELAALISNETGASK